MIMKLIDIVNMRTSRSIRYIARYQGKISTAFMFRDIDSLKQKNVYNTNPLEYYKDMYRRTGKKCCGISHSDEWDGAYMEGGMRYETINYNATIRMLYGNRTLHFKANNEHLWRQL